MFVPWSWMRRCEKKGMARLQSQVMERDGEKHQRGVMTFGDER